MRRAGLSPARRTALGLLIAALVAAAAAAFGWRVALGAALDDATESGRTQLSFAASTMGGDLDRFKLLAKTLAGAIEPGAPVTARKLEIAAAMSGARDVVFAAPDSSQPEAALTAVKRAGQGAIGFGYDAEDSIFHIAAPVWRNGAYAGAVMATIDAEAFEWAWRALPEVLFFAGVGGRIRVSSLAGLRGRAVHSAEGALPLKAVAPVMGHVVWRFDDEAWRALGVDMSEALVLTEAQPAVEMTAFMLLDTAPARSFALTFSAAVGAGVFALCLLVVVALQRRAALTQRLAIEARANAALEGQVARRTRDLTEEIAERRQAEAALRATQDELIQAGKMSALGHMAAGLSHELNQPLTAIRGFADNASILLERQRTKDVAENLSRISRLTTRTARIIKNLRAFARNEPEPASATSLGPVIEEALALSESRIRAAGAKIVLDIPSVSTVAISGSVRLQQVLLNLIVNALDAQEGDAPVIEIALERTGEFARITVRDHGPGVPAEVKGRVFDPFFTTKPASGEGEGMGLGLSISYRIIQGFGGDLRVDTHPEGGAIFTVELPLAAEEALAS